MTFVIAIYDSDDSFYKNNSEDEESGDSSSDAELDGENKIGALSRLGQKFVNSAAIAAEKALERKPGRHLLPSIGAAARRHNLGLDKYRQKPLADFLGVEHCMLESKI